VNQPDFTTAGIYSFPGFHAYLFNTVSSQGIDVFSVRPVGPQGQRVFPSPTVTYPYDGPRGDGASCMINMERLAANRTYFNLELEGNNGETRITEIKFDANRLRCYGGWAVEGSNTVAPSVRARTWLKLEAVLEDGPPPRLLLRVDGQLIYTMPLASRVRLTGIILKGWAHSPSKSRYARLAFTDSIACAAARLVSIWLLRRTNSDVALVVLAFVVPAPLLDTLRANSAALRGKRQVPKDRGDPLPTVNSHGALQFAYAGYGPPPVAATGSPDTESGSDSGDDELDDELDFGELDNGDY